MGIKLAFKPQFCGLCLLAFAGTSHAAPKAPSVAQPVAPKAAVLSALHTEQPIEKKEFSYGAAPGMRIAFSLAKPASVTVRIKRHFAVNRDFHAPILAEPILVKSFDLKNLKAGIQTVNWDGLDAKGQPVSERNIVSADELKAQKIEHPTPAQLVKDVPVNWLQVEVQSGKETLYSNFERAVGTVEPSLSALSFAGAVRDREGNLVAADRIGWRGRKFSPSFQLQRTFPESSLGQSSSPVETGDAAVDSKGNTYFLTSNGIYKYAPDGQAANWGADEDYINYPYPSESRNVLGVRLDAVSTEAKDTVFGPGGSGHTKRWVGAEQVKKPGFAGRWGGMAIDGADTVYFARVAPNPEIQIFDINGHYKRSIPLPDGAAPSQLRFASDGALWAVGENKVWRLDAQIGAVQQTLDVPARSMFLAKGVLWLWSGTQVWRFDDKGNPLPFAANSPYHLENGAANQIDLSPRSHKAPDDAAAYTNGIFGFTDDGAGGFFVVEQPKRWDVIPARLLHFDTTGAFAPELVTASLVEHVPGNVFQGDEPARLDALVTNLTDKAQDIAVNWSLTDYNGIKQSGTSRLLAAPLARQTLPLVLPVTQNGYYDLHSEIAFDGKTLTPLHAQLGRIPRREIYDNRWSPFAMTWGTNFYLMGLAGAKSQRGDSASWGRKVEPLPGAFYPTLQDPIQYGASDIESYRRYARRWSCFLLNGLDYGEMWLGNDAAQRLSSYDRFYDYTLRTLDTFGGKGEAFYQFWNEPNFFWHVPGPFGREHFALVTQHEWSMVKARDKNAMLIPDGDAGGLGMMQEFAAYGASDANDGVQIHYPGAAPLAFDKMTMPDLPEGKVGMVKDLVALRDREFPGKPIWNTEEGWWSLTNRTPQLGAQYMPRTYIPQIAAGVDKLYYFSQTGTDSLQHDPMCLLDENGEPFPAFLAYATMTRMVEDAPYAGQTQLGDGTFAYLFARGNDYVLSAWSVGGEKQVSIPLTSPPVSQVTVVDLMGRATTRPVTDGKLTITLNANAQYIVLPNHTVWARNLAQDELKRQLQALKLGGPTALSDETEKTAKTAATDKAAMTRLYYLVKAAEQEATQAQWYKPSAADAPYAARTAREAVEKREGADGYLLRARVALDWTERLAHLTARSAQQKGRTQYQLAIATFNAGRATQILAQNETPVYPGAAINAYLEPDKVPGSSDPTTRLDEKFPFEVTKKAGESFQLELTMRNYYRHPINGTLAPRLPTGWTATPAPQAYALALGEFKRVVFTVQIPPDAKARLFTVGGTTQYAGQTVPELHAGRVRIGG